MMIRRLALIAPCAALLYLQLPACNDRDDSVLFEDPAAMDGTGSDPDVVQDNAGLVAAAVVDCFEDLDCDDGDACTGVEHCVDGQCKAGIALTCRDGDPCTTDACDSATGTCSFTVAPNGTRCQDGELCDGQTCHDGKCVAGTPVKCADDGDPCTGQTCVPATGTCEIKTLADGSACSDGNACNGAETCQGGACQGGTAPSCDDGNPCTVDSCDPVQGCKAVNAFDGTSCSDGNACNGAETCRAGVCSAGTPLKCDDHNVCTADVCNPANGTCSFSNLADGAPCPDGNLCDGQTCNAGVCTAGAPVVCASIPGADACSQNVCVPATGSCAPASEGCDDGNPCTADSCSATGCQHDPVVNGTPCTNDDLCTAPDTCFNGVCADGFAISCTAPQTCNPSNGHCE